MKTSIFCGSSVILLLVCSLCLAAEPKRTTLGLTSRVGSFSLPFVVAEEKGFFKSEGLNTVVVVMQNQVVVQGVLSRNVDYGGTFSNFVGAALAGLPLRIVMAAMDGSDHVLVTSQKIKRVEDLRGRIIGISSFGGTPHSEAVMILKKYGLNPDKDVTFVQVGGSSRRYAALESGAIHGAMLVPPFNKIGRKRGFNELLSFNDVVRIPLGGIAVHVDKMREAPGEVVRVIKAVLKSIDYIHNRKADILALMEKDWGVKEAEVREGIYHDIVGLYSRTGVASNQMMENVIRMTLETREHKGDVPLSRIVDWSLAKKADAELNRR
jgi:ABC-type nitrate/sulfonate/bicarbonate transport system substrate-binding protein